MICTYSAGCPTQIFCHTQNSCPYIDSPKTPNSVNHPSHYTKGNIECIDAMKASCSSEVFRGHLKLTAFKYLWRYEKKENPLQDLEKAEWYLKRLIEEVKGEA